MRSHTRNDPPGKPSSKAVPGVLHDQALVLIPGESNTRLKVPDRFCADRVDWISPLSAGTICAIRRMGARKWQWAVKSGDIRGIIAIAFPNERASLGRKEYTKEEQSSLESGTVPPPTPNNTRPLRLVI